ncbi:MAG: hypothetical protein OXL96_14505 [Candidatus Poribacteria bacterium]|nr:hypothetical protein [Candidatus Poribacteria bacterium]
MVKINNTDITMWALPENAIARLGRGRVRDVAFSPDGVHLAVATDIGLWWYELSTMQPVALWETERGWFLLSPFPLQDPESPLAMQIVLLKYGKCNPSSVF